MLATPKDDLDLVTVVIPAWNAAGTLDDTLDSVRAQTHSALEIVVVDDGSSDRTGEIAAAHAQSDPRVRLVAQTNQGVAAARNHGAAAGRGDILAFIDADDLWAPDKIAKQLRALRARPGAGLVYNWHARIDGDGWILDDSFRPEVEGDASAALCFGNIVGSGSSALITRGAFEAAGGFEPELRRIGAQGCEDLLFYFLVAQTHAFALVPEVLTGYRTSAQAMSKDFDQMLRSWRAANERMGAGRPDLAERIAAGRARYIGVLLGQAIHARAWRSALRLALAAAPLSPLELIKAGVIRPIAGKLRRHHRSVRTPRRFESGAPAR